MKITAITILIIISSTQILAQSKYRDTERYSLGGKDKIINTFKSSGYVTKDSVKYNLKDGKATVYRDGYPNIQHHADIYIEDTVKYNGKKYIVTEIEENAWYEAHRVLSFRLPKNITKIPYQAFRGCYAIEKISIPENVVEIDDWAFFETGIDSLVLPDKLERIGCYSFSGCSSLKYISIPSNIKKIEKGAFENCIKLKTIIIKATIPPSIEKNMFRGLLSYYNESPDLYKPKLLVPKESVDLYKQADGWSNFQIIQSIEL